MNRWSVEELADDPSGLAEWETELWLERSDALAARPVLNGALV